MLLVMTHECLGANGRILGGEKGRSDVRKHSPKHVRFLDLGAQTVRSGEKKKDIAISQAAQE